jgi:hypothetical protein
MVAISNKLLYLELYDFQFSTFHLFLDGEVFSNSYFLTVASSNYTIKL